MGKKKSKVGQGGAFKNSKGFGVWRDVGGAKISKQAGPGRRG